MSDESLRIFREQIAALLRELDASGADIASIHSQLATDIVAKLRALPENQNMSTEQLQALFEQEIAKTLPKRASIIRTNIEAGAAGGRKAARMTIRTVFGDQVQDKHVRATAKALSEAGERIAGRVTVDGVGLTKRIRRNDRETAQEMARAVQDGIRQRKGILGAARKIEAIDTRPAELPRYLQELEEAARRGSADVKALAKSYAKRISQLGEIQIDGTYRASTYSLRTATKKFVQDIQKAGGKGVDQVVDKYIKDKLAYQANRIARSESVEAYRQSYVAQSAKKPGVYAFQWTLSNRHASHAHGGSPMDVCDVLANQNLYGLGPGVYPAAHVPKMPHANCICGCHALLRRDVFDVPESEQNEPPASARDHKSPDAVGWLKQNDAAAARILGPTRYAIFKDGRDVLDANGAPRLVRDLLGHREAAE